MPLDIYCYHGVAFKVSRTSSPGSRDIYSGRDLNCPPSRPRPAPVTDGREGDGGGAVHYQADSTDDRVQACVIQRYLLVN